MHTPTYITHTLEQLWALSGVAGASERGVAMFGLVVLSGLIREGRFHSGVGIGSSGVLSEP